MCRDTIAIVMTVYRRRLRTFPSRTRLVTAAVPLPKLTESLKGITAKKVNAT